MPIYALFFIFLILYHSTYTMFFISIIVVVPLILIIVFTGLPIFLYETYLQRFARKLLMYFYFITCDFIYIYMFKVIFRILKHKLKLALKQLGL
jgi:hypothetical protein